MESMPTTLASSQPNHLCIALHREYPLGGAWLDRKLKEIIDADQPYATLPKCMETSPKAIAIHTPLYREREE